MCYKAVHNLHFHIAEILRRGKVLATATNKPGGRSNGCGWSTYSLHAERAVVKRFGDVSQLRGCILVVKRFNQLGEVLGSKPCNDCQKFLGKCMNKYGLLKVYYS